jgi:hypothetical protein
MNENDMPVYKSCANCLSEDCSGNKQSDFDWLQVNRTGEHDQTLVDARMLGIDSSTESRKTTNYSNNISTERYSDYWLKRFMASFDKMGTFLRRGPRAKTHMEAHAPSETLKRSDTN